MKLHVLYDESGAILAAVRIDQELSQTASSGEKLVPPPRPVPEAGQHVADVEVPDEFKHLSFLDVCEQLVVEDHDRQVTLTSRKANQA